MEVWALQLLNHSAPSKTTFLISNCKTSRKVKKPTLASLKAISIARKAHPKISFLTNLPYLLTLLVSVDVHNNAVLEYRNPENNKLYHHKMSVKKLKK